MKISDAEKLEQILIRSRKPDGTGFSDWETRSLSLHYRLVRKWNPRLHLTTITDPQEFYERHIFESIYAEQQVLKTVHQIWDIGSGAGVPGVIISICRPATAIYLVESSRKKALFLEEVISEIGLANATVIEGRFQSLDPLPENSCLTVRAIEGMERSIESLVNIGGSAAQMLLLGGKGLCEIVRSSLGEAWRVEDSLIPGSRRRHLVSAIRST